MIFLVLMDIYHILFFIIIFYYRIKERSSEKDFHLFFNIKISKYKILDRFFLYILRKSV